MDSTARNVLVLPLMGAVTRGGVGASPRSEGQEEFQQMELHVDCSRDHPRTKPRNRDRKRPLTTAGT